MVIVCCVDFPMNLAKREVLVKLRFTWAKHIIYQEKSRLFFYSRRISNLKLSDYYQQAIQALLTQSYRRLQLL